MSPTFLVQHIRPGKNVGIGKLRRIFTASLRVFYLSFISEFFTCVRIATWQFSFILPQLFFYSYKNFYSISYILQNFPNYFTTLQGRHHGERKTVTTPWPIYKGETLHQSADQINSLPDVNSSSAPAATSTADDKCNSNHNNVNKVGAVHKSSPAPAPSPSPADDNNNNCNNRNIRSEKPQPEGPEYWKKNTVLIVGDSMLKNINEWTLSRRYTTKVRCFRGSTVDDLHDYIKPLLRKRPDKIILVIGTNDIENKSVADVLKGIKSLLDMILEKLPDCHIVVSEIIKRAGKCKASTNGKINDFNSELKKMNIDILRQQNILPEHINQSGLHLNQQGDGQLAKNIISKIRSFSSL